MKIRDLAESFGLYPIARTVTASGLGPCFAVVRESADTNDRLEIVAWFASEEGPRIFLETVRRHFVRLLAATPKPLELQLGRAREETCLAAAIAAAHAQREARERK